MEEGQIRLILGYKLRASEQGLYDPKTGEPTNGSTADGRTQDRPEALGRDWSQGWVSRFNM